MPAPETREAFRQGAETMTGLLAVMLGPTGRSVLVDKVGSGAPDVITHARSVARKVMELPDPRVSAGAMLIRELVGNMRLSVGDGSATAAVLAREMVRSGARMVAAGVDPMLVQRGVERAVRVAATSLDRMARPLKSAGAIAAVAKVITDDAEMSDMIGEIFDIVGADGTVLVEKYITPYTEREYVEGVRWNSGFASEQFLTDLSRLEAVMANPVIAIANVNVSHVEQVTPMLDQALRRKAESVVLVAANVGDKALATMLLNRKKIPCVAIRAPGFAMSKPDILQDLAILTGAMMVDPAISTRMETFRGEYFGRARRVVATRRAFTIAGARGSQKAIRRRITELRTLIERQDPREGSDILQRRLANLSGGVALLKIGALREIDLDERVRLAEEAIRSVRSALEEGVVPGGGSAYAACTAAVEALLETAEDADQAAGVRIVADALGAPLRQIALNAGFEGSTAVARVKGAGPGFGFDALSGEVVDMQERGIMDAAKVLRVALEKAASTAVMILTTGALVVPKKPRPAASPEVP